jgi:hypothetical protein
MKLSYLDAKRIPFTFSKGRSWSVSNFADSKTGLDLNFLDFSGLDCCALDLRGPELASFFNGGLSLATKKSSVSSFISSSLPSSLLRWQPSSSRLFSVFSAAGETAFLLVKA